MNTLNRIELAIRRAASQMPNHQARAFRLLADEVMRIDGDGDGPLFNKENTALNRWREADKDRMEL